jgi:hypothetical protein
MTRPPSAELILPGPPILVDPLELRSGRAIPAIRLIQIFSPEEWEEFIAEWAWTLKADYGLVTRCGNAGDMGCDVIASVDADQPDAVWDNFQCKHYDHPLAPSDIWVELGKLCHYTHIGSISVPRRYRFVAPRGVGTKLNRLLRQPEELRRQLIEVWPAKCEHGISNSVAIPLVGALRAHVDAFDFSIVGHVPPLQVIEQHSHSPHHRVRFGGGLPPRPDAEPPPSDIADAESRYVRKLFDAYAEDQGQPVSGVSGLVDRHAAHFRRQRQAFYCAESLRAFSRDTLPEGVFERLQNQVYTGVIETHEAPHPNGLARLRETVRHATTLQLTSSPLLGRTEPIDLHGICHQLANGDQMTWVGNDE